MESSDGAADTKSYLIGKKLSIIGDRFFRVVPEKCTETALVATCVRCEPLCHEIKGHRRSSSNFLSHLKRVHGDDALNEYKRHRMLGSSVKRKAQTVPKTREETRPANNIPETRPQKWTANNARNIIQETVPTAPNVSTLLQDNFDIDILKFLIHSSAPLRTVDDPYFKKIFDNLNISSRGLSVASRHTVTQKMENFFNEIIGSIKGRLENVKYLCTSADVWSGRRRSFLGVAVHWLNPDNLHRESAALAIRRFKSMEPAEVIAQLLFDINNEFDLYESKVRDCITDNGCDFSEAYKLYGVENGACIPDSGEDFGLADDREHDSASEPEKEDDDMHDLYIPKIVLSNHSRCYAHTLTLCATADIPLAIAASPDLSAIHHSVMSKCSKLWRAVGRPKNAEIIQNIIGSPLPRPDRANWNSLYEALDQILQIQDRSQMLFLELELKSGLNEDDFLYIKEHLECAKPIADALNIMQDEKYNYYGTVMSVLFALLPKLEGLCQKEWTYCRPIAESFLYNVRTRFHEVYTLSSDESRNAAIAALAHPEFKNRWMVRLDNSTEYQIMHAFKEAVDAEHTCSSSVFENKYDPDASQFFQFGEEEKVNTFTKDLQILQFLSDTSRNIGMLDKYPEIKKVFIKYNTPLPSSASVERLFRHATMTNLARSKRVFNNNVEMQLILRANSHLFL